MTTSQDQPTTTSDMASASLLLQFEHYIQDLLSITPTHLSTTHSADSENVQSQAAVNQSPLAANLDTASASISDQTGAGRHKVLWVTESADFAQAQTELKDQAIELINIDMLSQSPPSERYELICFWLPSLRDAEFKTYLATLMHSRDLYAEYTLIVIADSIDLRAYGFVPLDGSPLDAVTAPTADSASDSEQASTQGQLRKLKAWQFNLFDYKPRPHWLNAQYWANPENWGKYRW